MTIPETERSIEYDRTRTTTISPTRVPTGDARCEWKEFKNMKNSFCGDEKDDVISYVSIGYCQHGGWTSCDWS